MLGLGATLSSGYTPLSGYTEDQFVMKVTTNIGGDNPYDGASGNSDDTSFKLPFLSPSAANKAHYDVDWGDGTVQTDQDDTITHDYGTAGTYIIVITPGSSYTRGTSSSTVTYGPMQRFKFNNTGDCRKVVDIMNWGCFGASQNSIFYGCRNMNVSATDYPTGTLYASYKLANLQNTFRDCYSLNCNFDAWAPITSAFTSLSGTFLACTSFNGTFTGWDTSNVTTFLSMFHSCTSFNQPLGHFDITGATSVNKMLLSATSFDQDLSNWDIENITDFTNFNKNGNMSTANYNATLIGWAAQDANDGEAIHFGNATTSGAGTTAKNSLINDDSWTFTDGD